MTKTYKLILTILVLFFCTGFDQLTKDIAHQKLASVPPISLLNDIIRIQYIENPGATLGWGSELSGNVRFILFVILNGVISAVTLLYALRTRDLRLMQLVGLLLIASGGLGNLLDRLLHKGVAIDFLNLGIGSIRTGIFNVADILIIAGACIFMIFSLKNQTKTIAA